MDGIKMIKKFKNGNVNVSWNKEESTIEQLYDGDFFWNDLYFNQINGYMYLIDYNTCNAYDMRNIRPYLFESVNVLKALEIVLSENNGKIKLYPVSRREYKSIMQDMGNGY